ncbi:excinuclease ABC subunit UvrA [Opitutia bacterium ISCC 51]|nr:excinuclease ABC subunit UvrA [Opitutae bacterium ISCC 51]QXD28788.1 excinuclease ABC subunit UvrA [Opitutae bacterium ISCC 52]
MSVQQEYIHLKGIRQNNLKGFDLDIPLGKLIVVTGLSGAGKSSLVFETLHAEGQRRYVETFSPYTRQFLELLDRPQLDSVENIRPSIAIQQSNTVKTTRSTVGTMTELTDFFKVWFSHVAKLYDPETGELVEDDNPETIWKKVRANSLDTTLLPTFRVDKPKQLKWEEILGPLKAQGYTRALLKGKVTRLEDLKPPMIGKAPLFIIQDRIRINTKNRNRFIESIQTALHFGQGEIILFDESGKDSGHYSTGLHSPKTGKRFKPATPALFSFNSPIGACPECRGFGRVIRVDYRLAIPNRKISIDDGAIKAWQGAVYGASLKDLQISCRKKKIPTNIPFEDMPEEHQAYVIEGDPNYGKPGYKWAKAWYGLKGFFNWLENNTYKMHVRVFLSRFRTYNECPACDGTRLQPESLCWKWRGKQLPDLYEIPVQDLLPLVRDHFKPTGDHQVDLAYESILTRLTYLDQVGLGYLTLNRPSKTLSGGEVERVNLTSCLGTSLVDTLFVLDEPSIGLHSRDIDRLIRILRSLTDMGNTVVVVEHDEAIIRAADQVLEIGPRPGKLGGELVFQGSLKDLLKDKVSITGQYLSNRKEIAAPRKRRAVKTKGKSASAFLKFSNVSKHNIRRQNFKIPLERLVCLTGVSGSGKSTLLDNVVHQAFKQARGLMVEDPAEVARIDCPVEFSDVVLVDQGPVTKTPRSNPILFVNAWDDIRNLFAKTDEALSQGFTAAYFSFNAGDGRCDNCTGLGYEQVEMQFLSDVFVTCPICEGERFKPEILKIQWGGKSISQILHMTVTEALEFFEDQPKLQYKLRSLDAVGLGYLKLGQPLNTLSGGESQRLKLVKYLSQVEDAKDPFLLLLDEPTTGLHKHDVSRLIGVLHQLVDQGHSVIVIEHNLDLIKCADWLAELGPEAGDAGGKVIAEGTPEQVIKKKVPSQPFLMQELYRGKAGVRRQVSGKSLKAAKEASPYNGNFQSSENTLLAAEPPKNYGSSPRPSSLAPRHSGGVLEILGAREHNLKNVTVEIPHNEISVVTGVSGSGKSSLAFDIVFAEGQRRFLESMSAYARQFVEQLPRPDIDDLRGIAPTVAIEQRVTRGSRKSTVATITEVAQYLRLLYARLGIQYAPDSGLPVISLSHSALVKHLESLLKQPKLKKQKHIYLASPLIRGRKGHHEPIAKWVAKQGYKLMRIDGEVIEVSKFKKLSRYKEHDIEVIVDDLGTPTPDSALSPLLKRSLRLGKGSAMLINSKGEILSWLSTERVDPISGEAYPELDPKHFSWNSSKGWCPECRGNGNIWFENEDESSDRKWLLESCETCEGERLNLLSRNVYLNFKDGNSLTLPQLLRLAPDGLLERLCKLKLDRKGKAVISDILPQIEERLKFMGQVGLDYLGMDRPTSTLSGGEAQRIRLSAQLGSNLSGVLYVLDEPSIGLHARDNHRLIESLKDLKSRGNTLLVVEHDDETMEQADRIIDIGPGAGIHGGTILANGTLKEIVSNKDSLTGQYLKNGIPHPIRGEYRELPPAYSPRKRTPQDWLVLKKSALRNLKGDDLHIPMGKLTMVGGISGAGKSTLIRDLLHPVVDYARKYKEPKVEEKEFSKYVTLPNTHDGKPFLGLLNGDRYRAVIEVDQNPIGKTPRSTPATYMGAMDIIRKFFANLPEAKMRGMNASTFSFNTAKGRCETCKGSGQIKLEMNFLPDAYMTCEDCNGTRYGPELNDILWKGKTIADILDMSFEEAAEFFKTHSQLGDMLGLMVQTGLGYLTLGQSSPTLSGGEAQRLKLVSELAKGLPSFRDKSRAIKFQNLYILEEPTIGLHMSDCEKLIHLLHQLVDQGHTVIVIEHNLDLLAEADYLVEVGPKGGNEGGQILYQGPVKDLGKIKKSPTWPFLKKKLTK